MQGAMNQEVGRGNSNGRMKGLAKGYGKSGEKTPCNCLYLILFTYLFTSVP
jgi:hypothetical protein